jgi:hypothetical protein
MLHRPPAFLHQELQLTLARALGVLAPLRKGHIAREDVLSVETNLDRFRELNLLLGGQQRRLGDALQV